MRNYLSASVASKALRFVWSRRVQTLMKQSMSSFLDRRNSDEIGLVGPDILAVGVEARYCRRRHDFSSINCLTGRAALGKWDSARR